MYGTTNSGGANGVGTVFAISPNGPLTTLVTFDTTNGASPNAGVIVGADGNLYGTTVSGGANNTGTIYEVNPAVGLTNGFTTLHSFSGVTVSYPLENADGAYPIAALTQGADGSFYGTTYTGGTNGEGTIYRLTLPPTITGFSPASGPVGTTVTITGTNLIGTTVVGFQNVHAASFSINSTGHADHDDRARRRSHRPDCCSDQRHRSQIIDELYGNGSNSQADDHELFARVRSRRAQP